MKKLIKILSSRLFFLGLVLVISIYAVQANWDIYVNGSFVVSNTFSGNLRRPYLFDIGYSRDGGGYMKGYIDEFRITKGIARWEYNFTPPCAQP